jgi:hypothetical protein
MAVSGVLDLDANFGFTSAVVTGAKDATKGDGGRISTLTTEDNSYSNINDLDTRLSTIDSTTYTVAYLRTLTKNDKVYALRLATADVAGVK